MIPLSVPEIAGNEWLYVKECLDTGWVSSAGAYVSRFENSVAEYVKSEFAVACMNGTSALHLSLRILGVGSDDYVISPNITFVASVNSIRYVGAEPILIDAEPDTWQMDLDVLETFLKEDCSLDASNVLRRSADNRAIRAIMPVHVLGGMIDMHRLARLAQEYHLEVIEDATEALGSYFSDQHAGTFGRIGCFSFNGNKIITTGGGGMIVTNERGIADRARHLSTQAKIKPDEYIHDEVGYNYRLVNVLAAIGVAQMEQLDAFIEKKRAIDASYRRQLAQVGDITFQKSTPRSNPNCWLFTIATSRMHDLLRFLNSNGIQSRPFWMPMNQLPMNSSAPFIHTADVSDRIYNSCVSIPCSTGLPMPELQRICEAITDFFANE